MNQAAEEGPVSGGAMNQAAEEGPVSGEGHHDACDEEEKADVK
jgi:hypothetical protein